MRSAQRVMTENSWIRQLLIIDSDRGTFYTQVIASDERTLSIIHPINAEKQYMSLTIQAEAVVVYFFDNKQNMFMFESDLSADDTRIYLKRPDDVGIVQRRKFFRVPATLEVTLHTRFGKALSYVTANISGGGAAVVCPDVEYFTVGDQITGLLCLDKQSEQISFAASVVRIGSVDLQNQVYIKFIDIKELQRCQIIRFCQKREVEIKGKFGKVAR